MNKHWKYIGMLLVVAVGGYWLQPSHQGEQYEVISRLPHIDPDYTGIVIPPNIAPLNFMVKEPGNRYQVKIIPTEGKSIEVFSKTPKIIIPFKAWKKMLSLNRGQEIHLDISVEDAKGHWRRFDSITNRIAREDIDGFLVYRLINPAYNIWKEMGIYQRNLQNYDESPILLNRLTQGNCMNCHSFCNNQPDYMILHLRAGPASGTLLNYRGTISKVNTKTSFNRAAAYPAWHPSGNLLAFSVNNLTLFFHAVGSESRDVLDRASDLILYLINSNTITTCPQISDPERMETFPTWSPDGHYLYFCSAPRLESYISVKNQREDLLYDQIQYDLMRIRYEPETGTWGELETVLSAAKTGLSIVMPRISPDGRYLLFCMVQYGSFPIYLPGSDLYLMDLNTGQYYKLDINSDQSESYHSWSSNSRWFVFSSKRRDDPCARPYFSYVDEQGHVHKPLLMPQRDPAFYDTFFKTYNVPELLKEPVTVSWRQLTRTAFNNRKALQAKLAPEVESRVSSKEAKPMPEWHPAPQ